MKTTSKKATVMVRVRRQVRELLDRMPEDQREQLIARLNDPLVLALEDKRCPLSRDFKSVGTAHFVFQMTAKDVARLMGKSVKEVRQMLAFLRGWRDGITHQEGSK